jgi:hypothetical protein
MTKFSVDQGHGSARSARPSVDDLLPPAQRSGSRCELYTPGHQMHYKHQGAAVRSPAAPVRTAVIEGSQLLLALDGARDLVWRHHDPERLRRILELLRGTCVVYPEEHALRVGPYWFNCSPEGEPWQDCRVSPAPRPP